MKADVSSSLVTELSPKTDYTFTVYAIYPNMIGDSVKVTVQTSEYKTHVCNTTAKCTQLKCNIYKFLLLNAHFRFFIFGKVCNNVWEYVRNLIYTNLILQYYVYLYYISVPFPFSSSSFTSGVQFPCYWGGIVFPASWLDSSTRET